MVGAFLCAQLAFPPALLAPPPPAWWTDRGAIDATKTKDDDAAANLGQLKHMASKAFAELEAQLYGGAGPALTAMIAKWKAPPAPGVIRDDFAAVNLGQLKAVANPFYERLIEAYIADRFPWADGENLRDDEAIANLGQLKQVFSFDPAGADSDKNGLPDRWERFYFGHLGVNPHALAPGMSGLTNLASYQNGTNPNIPDTDDDGILDQWELLAGMNPLNSDDATAEAPGEDGATYLELYQNGAPPGTIGQGHDPRRVIFTSEAWKGAAFNRAVLTSYPQLPSFYTTYYHLGFEFIPPSDDGFNGDADLEGNKTDPGDPRDRPDGTYREVWWEITEEEYREHEDDPDYIAVTGTEADTSGTPTERVVGTYRYWNNDPYRQPISVERSPTYAAPLAPGMGRAGWEGDGRYGILGKAASASWRIYSDSDGYHESADREWHDVCIQTNIPPLPGRRISRTFRITTTKLPIEQADDTEDSDNTDNTAQTSPSTPYEITTSEITLTIGAGSEVSEVVQLTPSADAPNTQVVQELAETAKVKLREIRFGGDGYRPLISDDGKKTYSKPQWTAKRDYPITFPRHTPLEIEAKFKVEPPGSDKEIKVKATMPDGLEIPETVLVVSGGTGTLPKRPCSGAFANTIHWFNRTGHYAPPFRINWQVKIGEEDWTDLTPTDHTVYITNAEPIRTARTLMRESLFNISCREGAGMTHLGNRAIVDAIYGVFEDRDVERVIPATGDRDGKAMTYWGKGKVFVFHTTDALLKHGDGACHAWARLFRDVLGTQGIEADAHAIEPRTPGSFSAFRRALEESATTILPDTVELPSAEEFEGFKNNRTNRLYLMVNFWSPDLFGPKDISGLPGQGGEPMLGRFTKHALVTVGSRLYDPSYGTPSQPTLIAWENVSLHGTGVLVNIRRIGSQNPEEVLWVRDWNDLTGQDLLIGPPID